MSQLTDLQIKLVKAAKALFWKHGIKRVTVEEISEAAEVSKMSFYRSFKNKNAIAEAVLEQVFNKSMQQYNKIMQSDNDFRIKVSLIIKQEHENTIGISKEFIGDVIKKNNSSLHKKFKELNENSLKRVKEDFIKAQKNGAIRKDLNIDFMMYMLNDMNQKLMDKNLMTYYKTEEDLIMELTNFFFYGILP